MIEWKILANAIQFYIDLGYDYVEVPWMVSKEACEITAPPGKQLLRTLEGTNEYGYPVGSAEQGFLQLSLTGKLPPGNYVTCSPCFRNGDYGDKWHFPQFMKVELFDSLPQGDLSLSNMVFSAKCFFSKFALPEIREINETALDLEIDGIEVGSYGIGKYKDFSWVYGTGVAEPRLSQILKAKHERKVIYGDS